MKNSTNTPILSTQSVAKTAVVAALYVAITLVLAPISFGAVQLRFAEMFNYLALYNKRYVWGVTLGVFLANFASPTWAFDVPIGSLSTLLVLILVRFVTAKIKYMRVKYVITAIIVAISMFTIAGELYWVSHIPFWMSWLTIGIGELLSMAVGGFIIYPISKRIDLVD